MLKGQPEAEPSTVQLSSGSGSRRNRARSGGGGKKTEFVHAFADALRDILRDERRPAA
jgi:hypothetical protein